MEKEIVSPDKTNKANEDNKFRSKLIEEQKRHIKLKELSADPNEQHMKLREQIKMIEPGLRVELVPKEMVEQTYDLTETTQRLSKQYDKQIDMIKLSKQHEQPREQCAKPREQHKKPRELCVGKEQHCSEPRGITSVTTPELHELRDQGEPEPQSPIEFLQEKQSETKGQRECVLKEGSETMDPHKPRVQCNPKEPWKTIETKQYKPKVALKIGPKIKLKGMHLYRGDKNTANGPKGDMCKRKQIRSR
eukprot:13465770-Ditylum_brightwellii.AAC.1